VLRPLAFISFVLLLPAAAAAQDKPAPAPAPAPSIELSGVMFGSYNVEVDDAAKAANGGHAPNKFDINRVYITLRGPIVDRISFRVTTDIKQGGSTADYKGWFIRLKYAYLQYDWLKPTKDGLAGFARIGFVNNIMFDHEEQFWPRYFIQTGTDRLTFMPASDPGVSAQLTLPNHLGEIYGTIANGTGYEAPENNRFKDVALRLTITPLSQGKGFLKTFAISPWFYDGGNASKFATDATTPIDTKLARSRYGIFAGSRDRRFTFGGEYAQRTDGAETGAIPAADVITNVSGKLYDGFVVVRPLEFLHPERTKNSIGAVLRLDHFTPDDRATGYQQFIVLGVFWEPTRRSALAIDYQATEPQNGLPGTAVQTWFLHWSLTF
jgi:hypothetical protein